MTQKPDGGPAYPHIPTCGSVEGMSLRDYFAGQALAGYLAKWETGADGAAVAAYRVADAMIAFREQGK